MSRSFAPLQITLPRHRQDVARRQVLLQFPIRRRRNLGHAVRIAEQLGREVRMVAQSERQRAIIRIMDVRLEPQTLPAQSIGKPNAIPGRPIPLDADAALAENSPVIQAASPALP